MPPTTLNSEEPLKPWQKTLIYGPISAGGVRLLHSEKPHVFREATSLVAFRNTCGFSSFVPP